MDGIGLGMGLDLCVGLLCEHRFAVLKMVVDNLPNPSGHPVA